MQEDLNLIREILKGNMDSFNILINKYEASVFNFIFRMTRNYEAAQDITQEVFIIVYNKLYSYKNEYKFSSWLFQIARNKTTDYIRKYKRLYEVSIDDMEYIPSSKAAPGDSLEYQETRDLVEDFLRSLKDIDRQILILKYSRKELTFMDMAQILDMSESTVKGRYYRLRDKFKEYRAIKEKRCEI